ncbi:dihydrolipoyllysine-residue acetyltransferase [Flavobacteriaceae bacterium UJ101]|nr:dihydrolipoyllysine-residue acetyltransferase [Flavobacteriaceae bacterium UJ101]
MAELILMPRLSDTMEEGTIVKWHKNVGDSVSEGDIIAEIETDKAVQEFESEFEGTLLYQGIAEGSGVPVDSPLAVIGNKGEDFQALINNAASGETTEEVKETPTESVSAEPITIPEGIEVIQMPRLSDTMEAGTVAKWHKKVGDEVNEGDILAEIETDKAVQEFESEFEGTLLHAGVEEGGSSPVDTILAIIGPAGTDVSAIVANGGISSNTAETEKTETSTEAPKAAEKVQSTTATSTSGRVFASPLAKKIASDKGIDLSQVQGSGENGRIIKKDVENFTPSNASAKAETSSVSTVTNFIPAGETTETAISQMRKVIAKRLSESKFTAPHYYLNIEIDMENAMASRKAINAIPDTKVSFNDLVIKASAAALRKHPEINTTWGGDKIITHGDINIGVAVAVPDGLVVPVVNNADYLQLTQISASVKELAGKARDRKLTAEEMSGSTFTISNLGMFGIESFTSIINAPNSCILSVGAIVEKPVVKNGQIVVGHTMKVTLAADHRTVDGALGSAFLQTLKTMIENPVTILA